MFISTKTHISPRAAYHAIMYMTIYVHVLNSFYAMHSRVLISTHINHNALHSMLNTSCMHCLFSRLPWILRIVPYTLLISIQHIHVVF